MERIYFGSVAIVWPAISMSLWAPRTKSQMLVTGIGTEMVCVFKNTLLNWLDKVVAITLNRMASYPLLLFSFVYRS